MYIKPLYVHLDRRALEVLLRKLLLYPGYPAVVYMHLWVPTFHSHSFYRTTIEDETEVLLSYYGVQSLSLRNAIFHDYAAGRLGFREEDIACRKVHLSYLGHR
jgi:hypothetical protein